MAAMFTLAFVFKFADIGATAGYIATAGFPLATALAWIAAFFDLALVLCFVCGVFFREAAPFAAVNGPARVLTLNRGWLT
jgi:putative oxidoreductase